MDLRHHLRILWRWRRLLAGGLVAATFLAFFVTFKPAMGGVQWRSEATFASASRVMVTQPGFPLGRAILPGSDPTQPVTPAERGQKFAPPERFSQLAVVYSYLAQSQQIRSLIAPRPLEDQIKVVSLSTTSGDPLPLLEISTEANSPVGAQQLGNAVIAALRGYLNTNTAESGVPPDTRVDLLVLNPPEAGKLVGGHSITLFMMTWLLAAAATLGAVYVLENLYPGKRTDEERPQAGNGASAEPALNEERPQAGNGASAEPALNEERPQAGKGASAEPALIEDWVSRPKSRRRSSKRSKGSKAAGQGRARSGS